MMRSTAPSSASSSARSHSSYVYVCPSLSSMFSVALFLAVALLLPQRLLAVDSEAVSRIDVKHRGARNQASLIFEAMSLLAANSTTVAAATTTAAAETAAEAAAPSSTTAAPSSALRQQQKQQSAELNASSGDGGSVSGSGTDFHELIYGLVRNMQLNASHIRDSVLDAVDDKLPDILHAHDKAMQGELLSKLDAMIHGALAEELEKHDRQLVNRAVVETEEHVRAQMARTAQELENRVIEDVEARQAALHRDNLRALRVSQTHQQQLDAMRFRQLRGKPTGHAMTIVRPVSKERSFDNADDGIADGHGQQLSSQTGPFATVEYRYVSPPLNESSDLNRRVGDGDLSFSFVCEGIPAYAVGHALQRRLASALANEFRVSLAAVPPATASHVDRAGQALVGWMGFTTTRTPPEPVAKTTGSATTIAADTAFSTSTFPTTSNEVNATSGDGGSGTPENADSANADADDANVTASELIELEARAFRGASQSSQRTIFREIALGGEEEDAAGTTDASVPDESVDAVTAGGEGEGAESETADDAVQSHVDQVDFQKWAGAVNPSILNARALKALRQRVESGAGAGASATAVSNEQRSSKGTLNKIGNSGNDPDSDGVSGAACLISQTIHFRYGQDWADPVARPSLEDVVAAHFPHPNGHRFPRDFEAAVLNGTGCSRVALWHAPKLVKYIDGGTVGDDETTVTSASPAATMAGSQKLASSDAPRSSSEKLRFHETGAHVAGKARAVIYGYSDTDELPPEDWGRVFPTCGSGKRQSPVAIVTRPSEEVSVNVADLTDALLLQQTDRAGTMRLFYPPLHAARVRRVRRSLFVDFPASQPSDRGTLTLAGPFMGDLDKFADGDDLHGGSAWGSDPSRGAGDAYQLRGVYFHSPGEHIVDGERAPLEIHLVHERTGVASSHSPSSAAGKFLIVAVSVKPGATNELFASIVAAAESLPTGDAPAGDLEAAINLPVDAEPLSLAAAVFGGSGPVTLRPTEYFAYTGSLTAPPCIEGVRWVVLKRPLYFSLDQLAVVARAIGGSNARPPQNRYWVNGFVDIRTSQSK